MNTQIITYWDWLLAPFYIIAIYIIAARIKNNEIKTNPVYKYFLWGLFVKIFGAISLGLIYVYHYDGGDTLYYYMDGATLVDLLPKSPLLFLKVLFTPFQSEYLIHTGHLEYWSNTEAFNTVRIVTILETFGMKSYLVSATLMAVLSYSGIWKMYITYCEYYPKLDKQFAFAILFIPSVIFWGSGLLKDSITIAAAGWYFHSFYKIFIKRNNVLFYSIAFIISVCLMLMVKQYIFIAILPGSILWLIWNRILKVKSIAFRFILAPLIIGLGISIGALFLFLTSDSFGAFSSIDMILQKAYISYIDLKRDYYQGNSFDIGEFEPTLAGVLSKFPQAANAGLFRPYLWEAKNPVMLISGIENLIFISFTLYCIVRRPTAFISSLFTNPLVLFSIIFGVFFAFSVGISTSNFGALVRLRIPAIPFFFSGIIIVEYLSREKEKKQKIIHSQKKIEYAS